MSIVGTILKGIKWKEDVASPVTVRVDKNGFYIYWVCQNGETDTLEISSIRDTRTGKYARVPSSAKLRTTINCGNPNCALEDKQIQIIYGSQFNQLEEINFSCITKELASLWTEELRKMAYDIHAINSCPLTFLKKAHAKLRFMVEKGDMLPVKKITRMLTKDKVEMKRIERALELTNLPSSRNDSILIDDFTYDKFLLFYKNLVQRQELEQIFDESFPHAQQYHLSSSTNSNHSSNHHHHHHHHHLTATSLMTSTPFGQLHSKDKDKDQFSGLSGKYIDVDTLVQFLNKHQRDPRLNEILHPYADRERGLEIIKLYEPHKEIAKSNCLSYDGFLRYLLSDDNAIVAPEKLDLNQDMSQPLNHYFINSSHNTYLTGHQLRGKSSVDMYRQCLLAGCRCVELDCWNGKTNDEEPIITHGYTVVTEISFKEVLEAINESAFKTSPYPVILSFENHCSPKQQAKMVQYCKEVFSSDVLLTEPLADYPLAPNSSLPSPNLLKGKIIIKNKKKHHHHHHHHSKKHNHHNQQQQQQQQEYYSDINDDADSPTNNHNHSNLIEKSFMSNPILSSSSSSGAAAAAAAATSSIPTTTTTTTAATTTTSATTISNPNDLIEDLEESDPDEDELPPIDADLDDYDHHPNRLITTTSAAAAAAATESSNGLVDDSGIASSIATTSLNNDQVSLNSSNTTVTSESKHVDNISSASAATTTITTSAANTTHPQLLHQRTVSNDFSDINGSTELINSQNINIINSNVPTTEQLVLHEAEPAVEMSALVVYLQPVRFKSFEEAERRARSYEVSSFAETQATSLLKEKPIEFVSFNKRQFTRIYPKGTRVDSSNYIPQVYWNAGCQMVALNFQTFDLGMQLNMGLFDYNSRSGYILKPEFMRRPDRNFDPFTESTVDGIIAGAVSVKVISGQFLSEKRGNTFVEVEMYGLPADTVRRRRTKVAQSNGINPIWDDECFTFNKVVLPDLASLRIAAYEEVGRSNRLIGYRILPVVGLRPGYRHLPLRSESNQPLTLPTLFLKIEVKDYVPDRLSELADALANPIAHQSMVDRHEKQLMVLNEQNEQAD